MVENFCLIFYKPNRSIVILFFKILIFLVLFFETKVLISINFLIASNFRYKDLDPYRYPSESFLDIMEGKGRLDSDLESKKLRKNRYFDLLEPINHRMSLGKQTDLQMNNSLR